MSCFENCSSLERIVLPYVGESKDIVDNEYTRAYFGHIFGSNIVKEGEDYDVVTGGSYSYTTQYRKFKIPTTLKEVIIKGETVNMSKFVGCDSSVKISFLESKSEN